jgi:hypothetical protein
MGRRPAAPRGTLLENAAAGVVETARGRGRARAERSIGSDAARVRMRPKVESTVSRDGWKILGSDPHSHAQ